MPLNSTRHAIAIQDVSSDEVQFCLHWFFKIEETKRIFIGGAYIVLEEGRSANYKMLYVYSGSHRDLKGAGGLSDDHLLFPMTETYFENTLTVKVDCTCKL